MTNKATYTKNLTVPLLGSIESTVRELTRRLRQLQENVRKYGPNKVKNYIKTFEDKQKALQKKLRKWDRMNCTEELGENPPAAAWELSEVNVRIRIVPDL